MNRMPPAWRDESVLVQMCACKCVRTGQLSVCVFMLKVRRTLAGVDGGNLT